MNEQYTAASSVLAQKMEDLGLGNKPDRVINGKEGFTGEEAEELIEAMAEAIGLPIDKLQRNFPFSTYFEPEFPLLFAPIIFIRRLFIGKKGQQDITPLTGEGLIDLLFEIKTKK